MNATEQEEIETQITYDCVAAWLRDCVKKGDVLGVRHAEDRLKALDIELAKTEGEKI
jgi:hypothetical protein